MKAKSLKPSSILRAFFFAIYKIHLFLWVKVLQQIFVEQSPDNQ